MKIPEEKGGEEKEGEEVRAEFRYGRIKSG